MSSWYQTIDRVFVQPDWLNWLWLVAAVVVATVVGELRRARWRRRLFVSAQDPNEGTHAASKRWVLSTARVAALVLVVLALADPRAGMGAVEVKASKLQIVCLLDRSRSMLAEDVTPNRLEAGTSVVRDVVRFAGGSAVAVATFAGDARIDVPLTRDYQGLLDRLDDVTPDSSSFTGTNLAAGLATAATCFAERIDSQKILIVVTDGETHGVDPELPEDLLPKGTEVLILGVGDSQEGARIPLSTSVSSDEQFLMHEGMIVRSKANPDLLNRTAQRLDGRFQPVNGHSSSDVVAETLQRVESTMTDDARIAYRRQAAPIFHWFLLAAVGLLCLETILPSLKGASTRWGRFARFRRAKPLMLSILLPLMTGSFGRADEPRTVSHSSPPTVRELRQLYNQGIQAYRERRWSDAESLFDTVSRHAEGSLQTKAMFNQANAHYMTVHRGGISKRQAIDRLEAAIGLLRQVIANGERPEDARANIEIIYRRLLQIQQQQPDSGDDRESPPQDEPPDEQPEIGDNAQDESEADQTGNQTSGDQPQQTDAPADDGAANGSGEGEPPSASDGGGERSPRERDRGERSPSGPSPPPSQLDDPTEPLTDQQAEDQLRGIRDRARDRRQTKDDEPADADPPSVSPGLPW